MKKIEQGRTIQNYIRKNRVRVLISACLIAGVFVLPLLSEARYKAFLNGFVAVIAKEYYFSSNYLKEGGASYVVNGWDGKDLHLDPVEVRNYDNTLLANQVGQDLEYEFTWEVITYKSEDGEQAAVQVVDAKDMYTLQITSSDKAADSEDIAVEYTAASNEENAVVANGYDKTDTTKVIASSKGRITHEIAGNGDSKKDVFHMTLIQPESHEGEGAKIPHNKDYVVINFYSTNAGNDRNQYSREIKARLRYNVTLLSNFVEKFDVSQEAEEGHVNIDMATGIIPGTDTSMVVWVWWDPEKLSPNIFNPHFNSLRINGNYNPAATVEGSDRVFSTLKIQATSLTARQFDFEAVNGYRFEDDHLAADVEYKNATATQYIGYSVEQKLQVESGGGEQ